MGAENAVTLDALQAAGGVPAAIKETPKLIKVLNEPRTRDAIAAVIGNAMTPERMVQLCLSAAKGNDKLLQCSPKSVLGAMMTAAALGLEPNTPQQLAFLIPYKRRALVDGRWIDVYDCQFQIGYRGYITLAHRSPSILSLQADVIYENDTFEHVIGSHGLLKYQKKLTGRGKPIGAFAYAKLASGGEIAITLPLDEIEKVRACSDTWVNLRLRAKSTTKPQKRGRDTVTVDKTPDEMAKDLAKFNDTPWEKWFDDMAIKSAIKKLIKQLPMEQGSALAMAAQIDGDSGRVFDMESLSDPITAKSVFHDGMPIPEASGDDYDLSGDDHRDDAPASAAQDIEDVTPEEAPAADSTPPATAAQGDQPAGDAMELTAASMIERINHATDMDTLVAIMADIDKLGDADKRKVNRAGKLRRQELTGGDSPQMSLA